jgi:hypothetical protein
MSSKCIGIHAKYPLICQILTWIFWTDFEKHSNTKYENPPSGSRVVACGRTDRHDAANSRCSQFCERACNWIFKKVGWTGLIWLRLNTVMNLRVPQNAGSFLCRRGCFRHLNKNSVPGGYSHFKIWPHIISYNSCRLLGHWVWCGCP